MKKYLNILFCIAALSVMNSCSEDANNEEFENKIYLNTTKLEELIRVKPTTVTESRVLETRIAKPAEQKIDIRFKVDESLLERYNSTHDQQAELLPAEYYSFDSYDSSIEVGTVTSSPVQITFTDVNLLDRDTYYLLPVSIESASNIDILESERCMYYVVKNVPTISTVADLKENYVHIKWANRDVVNDLTEFTLEALIYPRSFHANNTVMGIEDYFLIRLGDGTPNNRIQVASRNCGNITLASENDLVPANEWTHLAVTYDNGFIRVYKNGVELYAKAHQKLDGYKGGSAYADWIGAQFAYPDESLYHKQTGFYIGYACEEVRYLDGCFSECRIWNIVRTQEEISNNVYEVDPQTPGLVAYWKFDEGEGQVIRDHTGNGNNAEAPRPIPWVAVSLPEQAPAEPAE